MTLLEYNLHHAGKILSPEAINASSWGDLPSIQTWQRQHGLTPDGFFGPKSIKAWRASQPAEVQALHPEATADEIPIFGVPHRIAGLSKVECRPNRLAGRPRRQGVLVNSLILHQSVSGDGNNNGKGADEVERILSSRGLGVDLLVDGDGTLVVYRDIGLDCSAHGNERNTTGIGVEICNPYSFKDPPWTEMIDPSPTAWKGREIADTPAQIDTLVALIRWLTGLGRVEGPGGRVLHVPLAFPTTSPNGPTRSHKAWFDLSVGGIIPHGHRPGERPDGTKVQAHSDARRTAWVLWQKLIASP